MVHCRSNILQVSDQALSRMILHLCLCFLQSCHKSLINQAYSWLYWENIGPQSFLYGPSCARSVLSRPRADILPVQPSCLVNKIHILVLYSQISTPWKYCGNKVHGIVMLHWTELWKCHENNIKKIIVISLGAFHCDFTGHENKAPWKSSEHGTLK